MRVQLPSTATAAFVATLAAVPAATAGDATAAILEEAGAIGREEILPDGSTFQMKHENHHTADGTIDDVDMDDDEDKLDALEAALDEVIDCDLHAPSVRGGRLGSDCPDGEECFAVSMFDTYATQRMAQRGVCIPTHAAEAIRQGSEPMVRILKKKEDKEEGKKKAKKDDSKEEDSEEDDAKPRRRGRRPHLIKSKPALDPANDKPRRRRGRRARHGPRPNRPRNKKRGTDGASTVVTPPAGGSGPEPQPDPVNADTADTVETGGSRPFMINRDREENAQVVQEQPSASPTGSMPPSSAPTVSAVPSSVPSDLPSLMPSEKPTSMPSSSPTKSLTPTTSHSPTMASEEPSGQPISSTPGQVCFTGDSTYVRSECLRTGSDCCGDEDACYFDFATVCKGSCNRKWSCKFDDKITVLDNSCNGIRACANNTGTLGYDACNGYEACKTNTGTIGNGACDGNFACWANTAYIGADSCKGAQSCQYNVAPIGVDSCHGDFSCANLGTGASIGDLSCTSYASCFAVEAPVGSESCSGSYSCYKSTAEVGSGSCVPDNSCKLNTVPIPSGMPNGV